ncbi:glycosyltransferase family 4 protein [Oricola sp.]|uniref:glycosyltransferase family 4 protein n=1 Tax=Oricola sp. TaxID=1979950 RepID=UPI003BAD043A
MIRAVSHLIDDASFGGVNRMLDHLANSPELARSSFHRIVRVKRGQLSPPSLTSDVIVSHLSINWANLPMLTALRAIYPNHPIIHVEHSYSQRFVAANVENRSRFDTLLRTAYSLFDAVVAVSDAQYRWLARKQYCPAGRLVAIPPCVDLDPYFDVAPKAPSATFTIGAIGRFDVQKGFDILLDGFLAADRKDLELRIIGAGDDRDALVARAGDHPRISIQGYMENTAPAIAACDAVAMPSRWEPYGLVALEAMAAERPVFCPRIDGLSDHIAAGAIDIGENSVDGWATFLAGLDPDTLAPHALTGRESARIAAKRFVEAWTDLIARQVGANSDEASAA